MLFADIKDSTELIRDLDPEDAQKLLDPAIHIMMEAVYRFEGTVNQVLGDGIMSIFGAPIAHEDHAARACYAALAMQLAMQSYADGARQSHGITMRIRVGLNSGEVVVRTIGNDLHMDYSAVGQTTHLAARMEQLAAPGSVVLSAATLRLVEGLVRVDDLGSAPVKGMSEPVEVYELTGASAVRRRLQAGVARGLTKFVGRNTELDTLNLALAQVRTGHGQIVAAVGEAGVGKSRLVYEFIHSHHTQSWLVLESASVSYGKATPYFPVIDLLKRYTQVEDGDEAVRIAEADGRPFDQVRAYMGVGRLYRLKGDLLKATPVLERGLTLCQVGEVLTWFSPMAATLGSVYTLSGRVNEALVLLEQAMEQSLTRGRSQILAHLSEAHLLAEHGAEARARAKQSLDFATASNERGTQASVLRLLGDIDMHHNPSDFDQAETHDQQALTLANELSMRPLQAHCHRGLGALYQQTGQTEQAHTELSTAIDMYRDMEMTFWLPETEEALAAVEGR